MKQKILFIMFILIVLQATPVTANSLVMQNAMGWNLSPNGMMVIGYDLDKSKKADFFSLREVKTSFFSNRPLDQISEFWPGHLVFAADYGSAFYYYITAQYPMLYAIDTNQDGQWDFLYKDFLQDGLNTNEQLYDNPSGISLLAGQDLLKNKPLLKQFSWQVFQQNTCTLPAGDDLGGFDRFSE